MKLFENSFAPTPTPSQKWLELNQDERFNIVSEELVNSKFENLIVISRVLENGQVYVSLTDIIPSSQRGTLLLDFEALLKHKIDLSINVWCEPLGDKNSLRKLRGIHIKGVVN